MAIRRIYVPTSKLGLQHQFVTTNQLARKGHRHRQGVILFLATPDLISTSILFVTTTKTTKTSDSCDVLTGWKIDILFSREEGRKKQNKQTKEGTKKGRALYFTKLH